MEGLFSRSNTTDIVFGTSGGGRVSIDLQKFKELGEEDPLIIYLRKVSERAKDLTVTYQKTKLP